ncbi:MAG: ParB N-terminal domain-containing protein [Planctomycetaceae bacterium]|jgi:hypothetical protein|nr:ParB N-terminal domain-containing protein [Planctomycetaceae bacterium]
MTTNLTINDELKNLLPPLSAEEFAGLEESIVKDGCLSPLVVWNDILVDGHHRYEICKRHQITFSVESIVLDSLDDAKLWIWKHQGYRRNLSLFQRVESILKIKKAIAAASKKRQGKRNDNAMKHLTEHQELARLAGMTPCNLSKVKYILERADEETKEKLRRGEEGVSIHKVYNELKSDEHRAMFTPSEHRTKEKAVESICGVILCLLEKYCDLEGKEAVERFLLRTRYYNYRT